VLQLKEDFKSYTHHGFDGIPKKARLDWILVSKHFIVRDASVVRDHDGGRYPSDHFPYVVDLDWSVE
jgi:endonuclease/exonuclease/phosphatase family metal-dependent hydrolase